MTREETVKSLLTELIDMIDNGSQRDLDRADEISTSIIKLFKQEPKEITLEDVKEYCKPRCLTIITNALLYDLTHPKIKALEQEPILDKIRAEIKHFMYHVNPNSSESDYACNYILDIIDKLKGESEYKEDGKV